MKSLTRKYATPRATVHYVAPSLDQKLPLDAARSPLRSLKPILFTSPPRVSHLQIQQRPRQTCDTSLGDPRLRRQGHGRRSRVRRRIDSFEKLLLLHPTAPIVTLMRFWSRLSLNSLKSTLLSRLILFPSSFSLPPSLMSEKTEVTSMHTNTN